MNPSHFRTIFLLKRCLGAFTIAAVVLMPLAALGVAEPTPTQHYTAAYNGDAVKAIAAASDGSFYVAGGFSNYATSYGNAVLASASTGFSESPFPDVDGSVYVTISDGAGGWYIGGTFNRVGTLQRIALAHILASGAADATFNADINCCSIVYSLAFNEADGILYVGGEFGSGTTFSGVAASGMFAVDASDGTPVAGFTQPVMENDIPISGSNPIVWSLAFSEETNSLVYVGGDFDNFTNVASRGNLAQLDADDGTVFLFNPNVGDGTASVSALAIASGGSKIYAGGTFTDVGSGTTRNRIAAFEPLLGMADLTFDPNVNGQVYALALDEAVGELYVGGAFTTLNGGAVFRNRLATVSTLDGVVPDSFNPNPNNNVFSLALTDDGSVLYAVGSFTTTNGGVNSRDNAAAFTTTTGVVTPFSQSMEGNPNSISLSDDEQSVLIGAIAPGPQHRADQGAEFGGLIPILHIMPDGSVDPDFSIPVADGQIYALVLSPDETTLYAAGDFSGFTGPAITGGAVTRGGIAAFDVDTGTETDFNPDLNAGANALVFSSDGGTLYAGGQFTTANQTTDPVLRNHLAAFDIAAVDPTNNATAFDPDMDSDVYALALSSDDGTLYAGGGFTTVNGTTPRNYLAAFTTTGTGTATGFNPNANNWTLALALSEDEETIYAGGEFTLVNGTLPRNYAAAFNPTTGFATAFDPDADGPVFALAFGPDGILYMGGNFFEVDGDDHNYIVAVDADTGEPDSDFDTHLDDAVYSLAHGGTDNGLLAGGLFTFSMQDPGVSEVPYVVTVGLALYPDSSTPAPTPTPTPTPGNGSSGGGGYYVQPTPTPGIADPANLVRYGLREGDTISTDGSPGQPNFDPDVYIVNEHGYKRLFLNPVIFNFYGHLGGFSSVKPIVPVGRDAFPTSGLFRNCETGDTRVYAVEVMGEDTGTLHHVQMSGDAAVTQDADFFKKVFCINNNEFNWYPKSPTPYTSLSQVPSYMRR